MAMSREVVPVEQFAFGGFALLAGALALWAFFNQPPEPPQADDLIPRVNLSDPIRRPRGIHSLPTLRAGHFADPFAPDLRAFRHPVIGERKIAQSDPPKPPPEPAVTEAAVPSRVDELPRVRLSPLPKRESPVAVVSPVAPAVVSPVNEAPPDATEVNFPGPVVGVVLRPDGVYAMIVQPEGWSVASIPLAVGDEWVFNGEHLRIVNITPQRVTVRDSEGRVQAFRVDGRGAPPPPPPPADEEIQKQQLLEELLGD